MPTEERLSPAEEELESALRRLSLAASGINRDRLMFQAGRASARRRGRTWQVATAALAAMLMFSVLYRPWRPGQVDVAQRPQSPPAVRKAPPQPQAPPPPLVLPAPDLAYLKLRQQVLEHGLEALPEPPSAPPAPMEEQWIIRPPARSAPPALQPFRLLKWLFPSGDSS